MKLRLVMRSLAISLMIVFVFVLSVFSQSFSFSNTTSIGIPLSGAATPYPSQISVPDFCCGLHITKVAVTLNGFGHTQPDDVGVLLVGPLGQKIKLMTDSGGHTAVTGLNLTFDDAAANILPDDGPIVSGSFEPTSGLSNTGGDGNPHPADFLSPAPTGPYSLLLSDLIDTSPSGNWSLYVDDDDSPGFGTISGGWTITVTVGTVFAKNVLISIPGTGAISAKGDRVSMFATSSLVPTPASPYPTLITVTNITQTVSKIKVKINGFVFPRWDDIGILLVGPLGQKVKLTSDNGGALSANGDYVFDDSAANSMSDTGAVAPNAGTYKPSGDGTTNDGGSLAMPADFPAPAPTGPYSTTLSVFNGLDPNGNWALYFFDDTGGLTGSATGWALLMETLAPTAAEISVDGRVRTADGNGISRAHVVLSGNGDPLSTVTNSFGYYHLTGLLPGHTYIVTVSARKYVFTTPAQVVSPNDDVANVDFVALPQ
jgi:subtilisin-like proprotein convertase family protein